MTRLKSWWIWHRGSWTNSPTWQLRSRSKAHDDRRPPARLRSARRLAGRLMRAGPLARRALPCGGRRARRCFGPTVEGKNGVEPRWAPAVFCFFRARPRHGACARKSKGMAGHCSHPRSPKPASAPALRGSARRPRLGGGGLGTAGHPKRLPAPPTTAGRRRQGSR